MSDVATPNQGEREFETGTDEAFKNANVTGAAGHNENQRVTYANIKRTFDVYQDLDIQAARQAQVEQTRLNQIASQALQNAVETANMIAKQVDASVTPVIAALQQIVQALATATTAIGNVVNQAQPKA